MHYVFRCLISRFCDLITNVNDSFYIIVIHIIAQYLEWSCFSKSVYLSKTNQITKLATPINALEI